jgi:hypothetical protein
LLESTNLLKTKNKTIKISICYFLITLRDTS